MKRALSIALLIVLIISLITISVVAQEPELDSTNYKILNPNINSGGDVASGSNYSLIQSFGDVDSDARLTSGSYELKAGFPNGLLANVPKINCFETNTNSGTTSCSLLPNANGMQGECGEPGCYDRAKLEIDDQGNPLDTLFLVMLLDNTNAITYYLQSDHTLDTDYDINDFMTQCAIEGRDANDPNCDDSGDGNWDESLQRYNVFGLEQNTEYEVSVSALQGDFTGTRFSQTVSATTESAAIIFDIDVAATDTESAAPYQVDLEEITALAATTATDQIWLDLGTNSFNGSNIYARGLNNGLLSSTTSEIIPSESEDLSADPNNNGGYGLKINDGVTTQAALGPLLAGSTYTTTGSEEVGAVQTTNTLVFFTDTSGTNVGPVTAGRGSLFVKARANTNDIAANDLLDEITFIVISNF